MLDRRSRYVPLQGINFAGCPVAEELFAYVATEPWRDVVQVELARSGLVENDVYIAGIFVVDEHQDGGVCQAVLTALLRIADREGLTVSLEVKQSTGDWLEPMYGRRGFQRTGEFGKVGPKMLRWQQPVISSEAISRERSGNTCTT